MALAAILSVATYLVDSGVTVKLTVESPVVEASPNSAPCWTAVFVVPSATVHLPF